MTLAGIVFIKSLSVETNVTDTVGGINRYSWQNIFRETFPRAAWKVYRSNRTSRDSRKNAWAVLGESDIARRSLRPGDKKQKIRRDGVPAWMCPQGWKLARLPMLA